MRHWVVVALVAVIAAGVGASAALYFAYPNQVQLVGGETRSELLSLNAPPGTLTTEANAAYKARRGARRCRRRGTRRRGRRLAELQQDAHHRAIL